jgi:hypothetical protein
MLLPPVPLQKSGLDSVTSTWWVGGDLLGLAEVYRGLGASEELAAATITAARRTRALRRIARARHPRGRRGGVKI